MNVKDKQHRPFDALKSESRFHLSVARVRFTAETQSTGLELTQRACLRLTALRLCGEHFM